MYSQRFLIRSMQLVGATRWVIIKAYVGKGILNGAMSGMMAVIALLGLLYYVQNRILNLIEPSDLLAFGVIFISVNSIVILFSLISTWMAVRKYLRLQLDDLY